MGQLFSSSPSASTNNDPPALLKPAIDGDLDTIRKLVGTFIASYSIVEDGTNTSTDKSGSPDPQLTSYASQTDQQQNSALHGAVFGGHLNVVSFLIETCGCSLSDKNEMGCSPIWIAAGYGHTDILKYLIRRVITTLKQKHPEEPKKENAELIRMLLDANNGGDTPLLAAASKGNDECCTILLESCPSIDAAKTMIKTKNNGGDVPLGVAVGSGHGGNMVEILLQFESAAHGHNNNNINGGDATPLDTLNHQNKKMLTPLLIACERNFSEIVRTLIDHGAKPLCDAQGRSPLAVASFCGCMDVTEMLLSLEMGKALLDVVDDGGCTPLWLAARTGNVKMTNLLLNAGANETIADKRDSLSPEGVAKKYDKKALMEFFDKRRQTQEEQQEGVNTSVQDKDEST